jgi:dipeptidase E
MKCILASAGFYTPEIVAKCVELVGKPQDEITIAVINEAYAVEHGDHGWVLDDLNRIKDNFKGRMELVNLLALDLAEVKERIELADVIFVVGGHTDYLMSVFKRTGFDKLLQEMLVTKVYVGSSAGSMVMCNRVSTEAYAKIYGEDDDYGITEFLGLVDVAIKPHFGSKLFLQNRKEVLLEVAAQHKGTVYGLSDTSAIVVEGDRTYTIGDDIVKIVDGKLSEQADTIKR